MNLWVAEGVVLRGRTRYEELLFADTFRFVLAVSSNEVQFHIFAGLATANKFKLQTVRLDTDEWDA